MLKRMMRSGWGRMSAVAVVLGVALSVGSPARALPIAGERTTIDVTSVGVLGAAGVSLSALGSAIPLSAPGLLFVVLPITGGDVNLPTSFDGTIEHLGSGLQVSFLGNSVDLRNFVIDMTAQKVTADVSFSVGGFAAAVPVFNLTTCGSPATSCITHAVSVVATGLGMTFTPEGAAVLTTLGLPSLAGFYFGTAVTQVNFVPEPATAMLLGGALVALAAVRRRRVA